MYLATSTVLASTVY